MIVPHNITALCQKSLTCILLYFCYSHICMISLTFEEQLIHDFPYDPKNPWKHRMLSKGTLKLLLIINRWWKWRILMIECMASLKVSCINLVSEPGWAMGTIEIPIFYGEDPEGWVSWIDAFVSAQGFSDFKTRQFVSMWNVSNPVETEIKRNNVYWW